MSNTETKWRYLRAIVPLLQLGVIGKTWEPFVGQEGKPLMNIQPFLGRLPMPEYGFPIEICEMQWGPAKCYFADLVRKCPGGLH